MKEIKEETIIVGKLFTGGLEYDLLGIMPVERSTKLARYDATSFYVRNAFGHAVYIVVKGSWVIEPHPVTVVKDVYFILDEEEVLLNPTHLNVSETVE